MAAVTEAASHRNLRDSYVHFPPTFQFSSISKHSNFAADTGFYAIKLPCPGTWQNGTLHPV